MKYLITTNNSEPFFTNWFYAENHFITDVEMKVYNLENGTYTDDGVNWKEILIDTL